MINKRAAVNIVGVLVLFLALFFAFNLTVNFVFADTLVLNATNGNLYIFNEDTAFTFNVSVNVTGSPADANVTQVNITLPAGFVFITDTNATQAGYSQGAILVHSFTNTSSVLSWTNTTAGIAVVPGLNFTNFIFNVTASTPGSYNLSVLTYNSTGATQNNLTITVNDITAPSIVNFTNPTSVDGENASSSSISINVSGADNVLTSNFRFILFNSSGTVNATNISSTNNAANITFNGLANGAYYVNVTANDAAGNENATGTGTRTFNLDTVFPIVVYTNLTNIDGFNLSASHVFINASITETNLKNFTFRLYNSSGDVNVTTYIGSLNRTVNYTGLADGVYYYNITVTDFAGNINNTLVRRAVTLDPTLPIVSFGNGAYGDGVNLSTTAVYINVSVTETNFKNITFSLFNTTSGVVINTTTYSSSTFFVNITGLPDGKYTYNVTAKDFASNENYSISRTIRLDMTQPSLSLSCTPNPVDQDDTITCSCTGTDTISDMNTSTLSFTTNPSTALTGTISTSCTGADYAGNLGSISTSYTVNGPSLNIGGGGGSGGSSTTTTTTTTTWTDAVVANDVELKEKTEGKVTAALGSSQRVKIKVGGEDHYVGVKSLGTADAVIEIASTPQSSTYKVGETKMFDLDGDGYYEVSVTLVSIEANKANVVVKSVYEKVPASAAAQDSQTAESGSDSSDSTGASDVDTESKGSNMGIIIAVVVVILLIVGFFVYKRRNN